MERTLAVLGLLAVTGLAVGAPRPTLHLLSGRHEGRHMGFLGHIINSTTDALLKRLNRLGGSGHHGGSPRPETGQAGVVMPPFGQSNSDANTYRPISEVIPIGGEHEQTGGGNSVIYGGGNSEETNGNGSSNGVSGQTSGTTQNSVDAAIHEIFGSGPQSSASSNTEGHDLNPVLGGPNTSGSEHEASTPSAVDIAIQEIFGGEGIVGSFNKPVANEGHSGAGQSDLENNKEEISGGDSNSGYSQNGEHKEITSNPIEVAIHDVFGGQNTNSDGSDKQHFAGTYGGNSGNNGLNSKPSSGNTPSTVDIAILEVFGRNQKAVQRVPNPHSLIFSN